MVTATGLFRQPERLQLLLAASSTWQTLCNASTAAEAAQYIHVHSSSAMNPIYPKAVVGWLDANHFDVRKVSRDAWSINGTLSMSIELEVPAAYAKGTTDAHNWFVNQIGAIVSEMQALAGLGEPVTGETHLNVTDMSRADGPWEYADDEVEVLDPDSYSQTHVFWIVFAVGYAG